jgi:hypothetical protein
VSTMFDALVKLLPPPLRPFAKAVLPALGTLIAVGVQTLSTGSLDKPELSTAITGMSAALVAFLATNHNELTDEEDDVPGADGLEFAGGAGGAATDLDLGLEDDEVPLGPVPSNNGHGDALLTNGPRNLS